MNTLPTYLTKDQRRANMLAAKATFAIEQYRIMHLIPCYRLDEMESMLRQLAEAYHHVEYSPSEYSQEVEGVCSAMEAQALACCDAFAQETAALLVDCLLSDTITTSLCNELCSTLERWAVMAKRGLLTPWEYMQKATDLAIENNVVS